MKVESKYNKVIKITTKHKEFIEKNRGKQSRAAYLEELINKLKV